jgi:hypothetical protein
VSLLLFCPAASILPLGFAIPGLSTDILWSGSWAYDGSLIDRGDIRLNARKPALTLRAQVTDKRPSGDGFDEGNTAFAGGLYHNPTGSRLLWGILDEGGLPARIKNVWNRGMPFAEQHRGAIADLVTEPSSTKEPAGYLWLGSPWLGPVRGFGSVLLDAAYQTAFDGGLEAALPRKSTLRIEGFYTRQHLAAKPPPAWFSETPPLPERDSAVLAGSVLFNTSAFAAAADIAWSETFAYGEDLYGNLGIRIGDRPWRLSLVADAAGSRYVGRDGKATGAGFRTAARLERRGKRSSLARVSSTLRAGGLGERFYRSATQFYYHFPTAPAKSARLFRPSRVSLTLNRDAGIPDKLEDRVTALAGFKLWEVPLVFQASLTGTCADARSAQPFPAPDYPHDFESARISAEASYTRRIEGSEKPRSFKTVQFGTKLGYTMKQRGENQVETSLSASARGKWGRFTLKVHAGDFPRDWDFGVSWRLQL